MTTNPAPPESSSDHSTALVPRYYGPDIPLKISRNGFVWTSASLSDPLLNVGMLLESRARAAKGRKCNPESTFAHQIFGCNVVQCNTHVRNDDELAGPEVNEIHVFFPASHCALVSRHSRRLWGDRVLINTCTSSCLVWSLKRLMIARITGRK